jgi:UPF0755 protein
LNTPLQEGWVRFEQGTSLPTDEALIEALRTQPREPTRRVVMYGGDTIHLFAEHLSKQTRLPKGELLNAYYRFSPYADGGILAGYYPIPYNTTSEASMFFMTDRSHEAFARLSRAHHIPYNPKTFRHYLIIASIIQKETYHTAEMPLLASVITNRLRRGMKLQLDATLNYGPYAHTPVTPERIRTDESAFNTYKFTGLPPEPIGSVSRDALDAAMQPAQTNNLYFVRNPKGWHDFSETYAQHLEKIRRYKELKAR